MLGILHDLGWRRGSLSTRQGCGNVSFQNCAVNSEKYRAVDSDLLGITLDYIIIIKSNRSMLESLAGAPHHQSPQSV